MWAALRILLPVLGLDGSLAVHSGEESMLRTLAIVAAFALAATAADAQKIDANGKCHDAKGKFAKMEVCKGAAAAPKASPAAPAPAATPAKGAKCKDAKGKFAKCGTPGAAPVPAKK